MNRFTCLEAAEIHDVQNCVSWKNLILKPIDVLYSSKNLFACTKLILSQTAIFLKD